MKFTFPRNRNLLWSSARFVLILTVSLSVATLLNRDIYKDYYSKRLFRLHTSDLSSLAGQMTIKLSFFLSEGSREGVQSVLDASFGLFGFVITDCKSEQRNCPEQNILYASDRSLPWAHIPHTDDLASGSFAILRRPPAVLYSSDNYSPGEIIGRLYVINNMPDSFYSDFFESVKSPFSDIGARRIYLRNTLVFIAGSLIIWLITELYVTVRRKQKLERQLREEELNQSVNRQMKQLAEKDADITRLNDQSNRQYEAYVKKIRALNLKIKNEEEYRELAEEIIGELEQDKVKEAEKYSELLAAVHTDMKRLQEKVTLFEESTNLQRESSFKMLEEAVRMPRFSNVFEQRIFELISSSEKYLKGEWRLLNNFDVAPGRNYRQFTDFILFNKDALIILEAKYYVGIIDSPGDYLNDIWISTGTQNKKIDCLWGENPYHQINEYSMSLMKILKQKSPWTFQIFGVIVFPDEADLSKLGEHIGKFYRITSVSKTLELFESIFAESRRFQAAKNPKRPKPEQVEDMLRGRKTSV